MNASLLVYDIPDASGVANPSGRLRRLGVRVNLSAWVIPTSDIPYAFLHRLAARGVTWHAVKFDASEGDKLIELATSAIKLELQRGIASARRSAADAAAELETADEPAAAELRFNRQTRAIVARVNKLIKDMRECAGRFGVDIGERALTAETAVVRIKAGMHERARIYAEAAGLIRKATGNPNDPMAAAIDADRAPHYAAADYLADHGGDSSPLQEAFGND